MVIGKLLDHHHLGFEILNASLDHDVHQDGQVLISSEVQLLLFHLHSTPKLQNILVYFLASVTDQS